MEFYTILIFGVVCGFILLTVINFNLAIYLVIFIFPLLPRYFGIDLGGNLPVVNIHRILLGFIILFWILRKIINREKIFYNSILMTPILFLCLAQLFSSFFSPSFRSSMKIFFSFVFEQYLVYFLMFDFIRTKKQVNSVIGILIISGVVISIIGIIEYFTHYNIYSFFEPARAELSSAQLIQERLGFGRIETSFGTSTALGGYLILIIPISLIFMANTKTGFKKALWGISSLLFLLALYFTKARGAFLGFLVSLVIIFPQYRKQTLIGCIVLFILFTIPEFFPLQGSEIVYFFRSIFAPESFVKGNIGYEMATSTQGRLEIYKEAVSLFFKKLIFGYGLGQYLELRPKGIDVGYYLCLLLDSGIFALLGFIWLVLRIFRKLVNCYGSEESIENKNLALALLGSVIAFLVPLAAYNLGGRGPFFVWWVLVALGMRLYSNNLQKRYNRKELL